MNKQRPVNLNLLTIKFPLPAIISILHRATGVLIFLLIPLLLWMLDTSLASPTGFDNILDAIADNLLIKFILWALLSALLYHLVAGIRHILMDMGIGESLQSGQRSATIVAMVGIVLAFLVGVWLW